MKTTLFIPTVLLSICASVASAGAAASDDATRAKVRADMEQGRAEGTFPLTEKQFAYPNWPELALAQHKDQARRVQSPQGTKMEAALVVPDAASTKSTKLQAN